MKKIIIVSLILISCHSNSNTNNDIDSSLIKISNGINKTSLIELDGIRKCSYLVLTRYNGIYNYGGTCFFYKDVNGDIYMTSAYHVLTGYNPFTKEKICDIDSLCLFYPGDSLNKSGIIYLPPVDVSMLLLNQHDQLDYISIKVDLKQQFNFINKYIDFKNTNDRTPNEVWSFGYPVTYNKDNVLSTMTTGEVRNFDSLHSVVINNITSVVNRDNSLSTERLSNDDTNKRIRFRNKYFRLLTGLARHGFSGSPSFGKFIIDNKPQFKFIGIITEQDSISNATWDLRAEYIYRR